MKRHVFCSLVILGVVMAGCTESPVTSPMQDQAIEASSVNAAAMLPAFKKGTTKLALCHATTSDSNPFVPIRVADGDAVADHLAHGDVYPLSPVAGQPGYWYNTDCEAEEDVTPPVCDYEISEDGNSLVWYAADELSGLKGGGDGVLVTWFIPGLNWAGWDLSDWNRSVRGTLTKDGSGLPARTFFRAVDLNGNTSYCGSFEEPITF